MIKLIIKKLASGSFEARIKDTATSATGRNAAEAIGLLIEKYGDTVDISYEFNSDPLTLRWTNCGSQLRRGTDMIGPRRINESTPRGTELESNELEKVFSTVVAVSLQLSPDHWMPFTWEEFQRLSEHPQMHNEHVNLDELVAKGALSYEGGRYRMTDYGLHILEQADCIRSSRVSA